MKNLGIILGVSTVVSTGGGFVIANEASTKNVAILCVALFPMVAVLIYELYRRTPISLEVAEGRQLIHVERRLFGFKAVKHRISLDQVVDVQARLRRSRANGGEVVANIVVIHEEGESPLLRRETRGSKAIHMRAEEELRNLFECRARKRQVQNALDEKRAKIAD